MRWKEILIGGLLVYKFTTANKEELLTYEIDKQVAFEGVSNKVSICSAKMANIGGQAAKDVIAIFRVTEASIQEFKAISSSGGNPMVEIANDKHSVTVTVKNLLPGEIISTPFLLSKEANVEMLLRSDKSIGKADQIFKGDYTQKGKI